ncbi:MAG TPA: chloride channel protein [Bacteroidota bacterium]|nr:chloride channel protein [Bacteroidota bacterium]
MPRRFTEASILFVSVLKWFVIASLVGVLVGGSTALFLWCLNKSTELLLPVPFHYLLLPVAFLISSVLVEYLAPDARGHGTEKVIEAIHQRGGIIKPLVVPVKLLATVVTLAAGGSAGKEGPCAQIGAGISSVLSGLFRFDEVDRKKLVICGVSAGFATVFGTPVAGALFGVEVLAIGELQYSVLFPSFVAGIIGYQVSVAFGTSYFHHPIAFIPSFSELFFIKVVVAGVAFGIISFIFIEILKYTETLSEKLRWWTPAKGLLGGALLLLTLPLGDRYLGLGLTTVESTLNGASTGFAYDPLIKMVATAITLSFGGSGGIVTPIFFIGATAGSVVGALIGIDPATGAALGMVGALAGCANTPISASVMSIELFGAALSPYAAITCIVSFLLVGHRSVYPSQILAIAKSTSLRPDLGKTVEHTGRVEIADRGGSLVGLGRRAARRIRRLDKDSGGGGGID